MVVGVLLNRNGWSKLERGQGTGAFSGVRIRSFAAKHNFLGRMRRISGSRWPLPGMSTLSCSFYDRPPKPHLSYRRLTSLVKPILVNPASFNLTVVYVALVNLHSKKN